MSTLQRLMRECKQLEEEALEAATMAEQARASVCISSVRPSWLGGSLYRGGAAGKLPSTPSSYTVHTHSLALVFEGLGSGNHGGAGAVCPRPFFTNKDKLLPMHAQAHLALVVGGRFIPTLKPRHPFLPPYKHQAP